MAKRTGCLWTESDYNERHNINIIEKNTKPTIIEVHWDKSDNILFASGMFSSGPLTATEAPLFTNLTMANPYETPTPPRHPSWDPAYILFLSPLMHKDDVLDFFLNILRDDKARILHLALSTAMIADKAIWNACSDLPNLAAVTIVAQNSPRNAYTYLGLGPRADPQEEVEFVGREESDGIKRHMYGVFEAAHAELWHDELVKRYPERAASPWTTYPHFTIVRIKRNRILCPCDGVWKTDEEKCEGRRPQELAGVARKEKDTAEAAAYIAATQAVENAKAAMESQAEDSPKNGGKKCSRARKWKPLSL